MENLWIAVLSVIGFILSYLILNAKRKKKKLICYIGTDCNKVIYSKYSRLFNIPNEIIGLIYFGLMFLIAIGSALSFQFLLSSIISTGRLIASSLAAIFSIILIFVQIFILKEYCEYCIASAIASILISLVILF